MVMVLYWVLRILVDLVVADIVDLAAAAAAAVVVFVVDNYLDSVVDCNSVDLSEKVDIDSVSAAVDVDFFHMDLDIVVVEVVAHLYFDYHYAMLDYSHHPTVVEIDHMVLDILADYLAAVVSSVDHSVAVADFVYHHPMSHHRHHQYNLHLHDKVILLVVHILCPLLSPCSTSDYRLYSISVLY